MDPNALAQLVSTIGFPIVCCGALFWQQNKTMDDFATRIEKSVLEQVEATNKNTEATAALVATVTTLTKVGE